jgi:hypothetical protein
MEMIVLIVLTFMSIFLALGVILFALLAKFYTSVIPTLENIEWDNYDEIDDLQPMLGVVHPRNRNLL